MWYRTSEIFSAMAASCGLDDVLSAWRSLSGEEKSGVVSGEKKCGVVSGEKRSGVVREE
jgi:hypothetical protein